MFLNTIILDCFLCLSKLLVTNKKNFRKSQHLLGKIYEKLTDVAMKLLSLVSSSPSMDKYSTMDLTHTELRSRLGLEKLQKLSFCQRFLKDNSFDFEMKIFF